jgi:hypothetical protein
MKNATWIVRKAPATNPRATLSASSVLGDTGIDKSEERQLYGEYDESGLTDVTTLTAAIGHVTFDGSPSVSLTTVVRIVVVPFVVEAVVVADLSIFIGWMRPPKRACHTQTEKIINMMPMMYLSCGDDVKRTKSINFVSETFTRQHLPKQ